MWKKHTFHFCLLVAPSPFLIILLVFHLLLLYLSSFLFFPAYSTFFLSWPPWMLQSAQLWVRILKEPWINIPELTAANLSSRWVYIVSYAYLDPCCTHDVSAGWLCAERLMLLNYREQKPIRAIADAWSLLLLIQ
jgi:hypothetical protein